MTAYMCSVGINRLIRHMRRIINMIVIDEYTVRAVEFEESDLTFDDLVALRTITSELQKLLSKQLRQNNSGNKGV